MRLYLCLVTFILLANSSFGSEQESFTLQNSKVIKAFYFNREEPGAINIKLECKQTGEKINHTTENSWFEFVINNQLVSSADEVWTFNGISERKMGNDGTEYQLSFEGKKGVVNGLELVLFQQIFPGSTLVRERLELNSAGKKFNLNKLDGKLHFRFPVYHFVYATDNEVRLTEFRMASWEKKPITFGEGEKGNHMYYPDIVETKNFEGEATAKGPLAIISDQEMSYLMAYEHASQDGVKGMMNKQKPGSGNKVNDAMQGIAGVFNFPVRDEDFMFLGISNQLRDNNLSVSVDIKRGGYLDGEVIDPENPYSTVWTATGFYQGNNLEEGKKMIREYLLHQICEKPASRQPEFYYNTWGMQRQDQDKPLRGILTYERIFEEIEYADQLGVDIFVLDDGWNNKQGEWFPHKERLYDGLAPIKKKLDEKGMKMGLWFSPMGIDSTSERYRKHPEWVIKDSEENPILAQWNHPAFDFVSGFFDVFVDDCKKLVDEGCRFMKWDAINTFYSTLPGLEHGSQKYSEEEIRARYEYLLPIYVVRAMKELTDYEPDLVIEMDLTEARRVMVGLAPLSQGKLFWMNNGASWYNDYTTLRTKSMRTIANEFAGIIPLELFTYANYPHNIEGNMEYNVHNSLLAGHGFWGNLKLMTDEQRNWIGKQVEKSKRVLPYLIDVAPVVVGEVGDSPEIYALVDEEKAVGQIICFSEEPSETGFSTKVNSENLLVTLGQSYKASNDSVQFDFHFDEKESSNAIFILPNDGKGISVVSSTSPILDAHLNENLEYIVDSTGEQVIMWNKKNGKPVVKKVQGINSKMYEKEDYYLIEVAVKQRKQKVSIISSK